MQNLIQSTIVSCLILISSLSSFGQNWQLIYENDQNGDAVQGQLEDLIVAVRAGEVIRVGWMSQNPNDPKRKVEHFAEVKFLTIMSDEVVFGQIDPIIGQTPNFNQQEVILKENLEWSMIAGSNGKFESMMRKQITGEILSHSVKQRGFKWFIRQKL